MARKKSITRKQIIDASHKILRKDGLSGLTARRIAAFIGCSTQPIYLEFKNMNDLKDVIFSDVYTHLEKEVYPVEHTGDPIVDLAINYINFANTEKKLYLALFVDKQSENRMLNFSYDYFKGLVKNSEKYRDLTEEKISTLMNGTWIMATGLANLASSGTLHPTYEQKVQLMQDVIHAVLGMDHEIVLDV